MPPKVLKNVFVSLIIILLIFIGWSYFSSPRDGSGGSPISDIFSRFNRMAESGLPGSGQRYSHSEPDFSFNYPEGFGASGFEDGEGETILVQKEGRGFQIYITAIGEDLEITEEKINQDIPDLKIKNAKAVEIGGATGLSFESEDGGLETKEIWFVKGQNLYQITSYPEFSDMTEGVAESWEWK